ncbi:hypothetical protein RhiirA4_134210 [Rhizophagus irregularis]|uniref:Uncharacterized protein n=1 Tax=Rhizophagus irregularis TaxID=588596 RepID=A0A2I1GBK7_9GLOM|nr:hypothetical protein RhiirA4_134210 [Rhizophagus irregularis]
MKKWKYVYKCKQQYFYGYTISLNVKNCLMSIEYECLDLLAPDLVVYIVVRNNQESCKDTCGFCLSQRRKKYSRTMKL